MGNLINLTKNNVDNFIDLFYNYDIIVYENILANKIFFCIDENNTFIIKTKSINNNPLSLVDFAIKKFYQPLLDYLNNIDKRIINILPKNVYFVCEYFNDDIYDISPKNNLILTSIVRDNSFIFDVEEIYEYAKALEITPIPILFYGKLTENQINILRTYLNTSKEDLEYVFGEDNFASFFYKLLNHSYKNSILMNEGNFLDNLDKIIINVKNENISLSLLNPFYEKIQNKTNYTEIYSIIICDFISFLQSIDLDRRYIRGNDNETIYIDLLSELFNEYIENREERLSEFDFVVPEINDLFKINLEFITNKKTSRYIKLSNRYEYIFRSILSAFRYNKTTPIGIMNDNILKIFNSYVNTFNKIISNALQNNSDEDLRDLVDFSLLFNIKYPKETDANGKHYINKPNIEILSNNDKKKTVKKK